MLAVGLERIKLHIKTIGVIDGRVFVERVDDFDTNGHHGEVPVVGVLTVEERHGHRVARVLRPGDPACAAWALDPANDFAHDSH